MRRLRLLPGSASLLAMLLVPAGAQASPVSLWVAPWEPGGSVDAVLATGTVIRDRFPDALAVDDPRSAAALAAAGHRVVGPFEAPDDAGVFLLRPRGDARPDPERARALRAIPGVTVLWSDGVDFLLFTDRELPPAAPAGLSRKALSPAPLRAARAPESAAGTPFRATAFGPLVDGIVARVDSAGTFPWIGRLAGAEPVSVGGQSTTFSTRYSYTPECATAEQYVYERFVAMGFTDVAYDPYEFVPGGASARNVVATLPGLETPDRIYILCGHLDSTSPSPSTTAPGANDNASGVAAVLAGAEILKDYAFRSTIRFIAFTGEEQGLVGSSHYAQLASAGGEDIRGVVNCDMIAWHGSRYRIDIEGDPASDPIMQVMNDACAAYTGLSTAFFYNPWGSDHVPFLNQGYPSFLAIESDYASYPCYHQTCDTTDRNLAGFGAEVIRACLATVAHLAGIFDPSSGAVAAAEGGLDLRIHPNPFRGETGIRFAVSAPGTVTLRVLDVGGRRIRTLVREPRAPGTYELSWDGRDDAGTVAPAGVYFVRLAAGDETITRRTVRLR